MPGRGKARGGSVGLLTAPSSISGPSASGFGRVRACLCVRVRTVLPFYLPVTVTDQLANTECLLANNIGIYIIV